MKAPRAPAPPDPAATARAQTSTNVNTAIAERNLNNVNQVTPNGTLTYEQTGSYQQEDPETGSVYDVPTFTATTELSEAGKQVQANSEQADINLSQLASDQSGRLQGLLSEPVSLDNDETENRLMELGRERLDPALERRREALRTSLSNQGIKEGSEAFDRAMSRDSEGANDAYTSLLLSGRAQSVQEQLAERNQPINEITALLSGSQVSQPQFVGTPQTALPTTDYAGLVNNQYAQQMGQYQSGMNSRNQMMGGLFGLGAAGITAWSDRRLKRDIEHVGFFGRLAVYAYRYIWDATATPLHLGFMADEVRRVAPDAVIRAPSGFDMVDYAKAMGAAR